MYAPSANHGFPIRDASPNGQLPQDFHSREKGTDNPPRLVIRSAADRAFAGEPRVATAAWHTAAGGS
jgi:hypothetical protein